nr:SBBP repeat-containing protein [Thiococcus pfennigii]
MKASLGGSSDAFVAKLDPSGAALTYSTYLGGSGPDADADIAVDDAGNAYVTGDTESADFAPEDVLSRAFGDGSDDAFVAKIQPQGSALLYATYLGGSLPDRATRIAVDRAGNAYVAGSTLSVRDFPTTPDAPQPTLPVSVFDSGFVSKLSAAGSTLVYSTFLAGTEYFGFESYNGAYGLAVDGAGSAYVTGSTQSSNFPLQNPVQPGFAGLYDAFVTKISGALAVPRLRTDHDFDGDGQPDLAVLSGDGTKVAVKDVHGQLISTIAVDGISLPVAFQTMDDFGGTSAPELVVLGADGVAQVRDGVSGDLLGASTFDPQLTPVDLAVLADRNGNGAPELAMLGASDAGSGRVEVRDAATGARITRFVYQADLAPRQLIVMGDLTGDGWQALAMRGDDPDPQRSDRLELRDPATGKRLVSMWLGGGFEAQLTRRVGDLTGDGVAELATLRTKPDVVNVAIHDPTTGLQVGGVGFAKNFSPLDLVSTADINGNGAFEVGVLARNPETGGQRVDLSDSLTKQFLTRIWIAADFIVQAAETLPDLNGNGAQEVAVLARREADGALAVYVEDGATAERLAAIDF